jgi:hypothetical protein
MNPYFAKSCFDILYKYSFMLSHDPYIVYYIFYGIIVISYHGVCVNTPLSNNSTRSFNARSNPSDILELNSKYRRDRPFE